MTDLVAAPVSTVDVIPQGMSLNPIFDWSPMLGVPLWVFCEIVLVAIFFLVIVYFVRKIKRLDSVKGWGESLKKLTQSDVQVWVISRIQRLTIDCMTIEDNIITPHDQNLIEMWHHNSHMARIIVGGNPGVVVSEDYHHTRDFISEIALTYNADKFNAEQELLKYRLRDEYNEKVKAGVKPDKPIVVQPIVDYPSYDTCGRKCLMHLNPDGLEYPAYNIFNPVRFRKYFPLGNSAKHFGGDLIEGSRDLRIRKKEKSFLERYSVFLICGGVAIIMILAAWFVPLGGK